MNKIKKIGLFDSGMGGLSVLQALTHQWSNKEFIYFADILNLPYGEKSKEELNQCCIKVKDFLLSQDSDALVIACNAASCLYLDQTHYKSVSLMNVISPTVKKLIEVSSDNDKVGVLATSFTVNSNVYPQAIASLKPQLKVFQKAAPDLAPLVEKGWDTPKCKETLKNNLEPLLRQEIDILVLGCTHYFFLKDEIKKILPSHIKVVDPLDYLVLPTEEKDNERKGVSSNIKIYLNQEQPELVRTAQQILKDPQITILNSF